MYSCFSDQSCERKWQCNTEENEPANAWISPTWALSLTPTYEHLLSGLRLMHQTCFTAPETRAAQTTKQAALTAQSSDV